MKNINNNLSSRATHHSSSRSVSMRDIVVGFFNAPLYPGLQISGMTNGAGAFTLIELLVVVLIIGILAAVALPQYQKAVEKSRAAQALTLLKSVGQAAVSFRLANGGFPESFDELSIDIPWTGNEKWTDFSGVIDTRSNADWSLQLYHSVADDFVVYIGRLSGKYKGAGFRYAVSDNQQIHCMERVSGGVVFEEEAGSYCAKIFKGTATNSQGTARAYRLP